VSREKKRKRVSEAIRRNAEKPSEAMREVGDDRSSGDSKPVQTWIAKGH
jgi:hypothetical protein